MAHPRGGWIKAHRRLFDPDFAWPIPWRYYFLDLIQLAAYRPHADLKRGQIQISYRYLADRWHVGKATIGRFLDRLESDGAIIRDKYAGRKRDANGTAPETYATIITLCNYEVYQATSNQAGHPLTDQRVVGGTNTRRRIKNLGSLHPDHPHPPSAAAPAKPTQRTQWPAELQKVWDVLLGNELLGTDLDDDAWWKKQLDWIESTGLEVYPLDELKAYVAHQSSQTKSRQHRSRKRGFRNWLATAVRWKERDATREAIRDRDRTRR